MFDAEETQLLLAAIESKMKRIGFLANRAELGNPGGGIDHDLLFDQYYALWKKLNGTGYL